MIAESLLKILCCPETHQPLSAAAAEIVSNLNRQIAEGNLRNRAGQPVREKIDGGLIRKDSTLLYPVRHGIPVMLIDEAIDLAPDAPCHR